MSSKIIGISGNMGAGKTTLAHALQQNLKSTLLCWDDFDDISTSPSDYVEWYHRSHDYNEWNYQSLADVLKELKAKQSVPHPVLKKSLIPTEYIIFDAPLGRLHKQTGQYIDILLHINVPLDVSLCRYELVDINSLIQTEIEYMKLRLYDDDNQLVSLLNESGFSNVKTLKVFDRNKQSAPDDEVIIYECKK
jgi:hypothetical protein